MINQFLLNLNSEKLGMRKLFMALSFGILVVSCGSSKPVVVQPTSTTKSAGLKTLESHFNGKITQNRSRVLKSAEKYLGVPYKFGGNTTSGIDCSGLTVNVFSENELKLPRRSSDQAKTGDKISIEKVKPGDLLFFATSGGSQVNHVGIVHEIGDNGEVKFIHASTSKGVIISSLNEKYWNRTFLHAQQVL